MAKNALEQGEAAAKRGETRDACPFAEGSPDRHLWIEGHDSVLQPPVHADAPFDQVRGLTGTELADVIGADDYEAGADDVPPEGSR
jgi:hypothetical protein